MENVHVVDEQLLEKKVQKIRQDGSDKFHVVSDFDRTLTPAFIHGQKAHTGIAQIREGGYLTPDYAGRAFALYDKYHPIEISKDISLEVKKQKMLEWWQTHLKLMIECGLNKGVIDDITNKKKIRPREGSFQLFNILKKHDIPLIIFSAGKGDLIEGYLESGNKRYKNIRIIANFYDYDEKGIVKGYKSNIIHSFNKNEGQLRESDHFKNIKHRKNVLLLGDSLGDVNMLQGIDHDAIIKVGFLNDRVEELFDSYRKVYDIVITNDSPMHFVNELLAKILE